jgi:hypothetical protein
MMRADKASRSKGTRVIDFNAAPAPEDPWEEFEWALGAEASLGNELQVELHSIRRAFEPDWYS